MFITNGLHADMVIVCAKTDPKAGAKGVSLFLVDTSLPGFSRGKGIKKIGQHASDTAEFFSDLIVPEEALLGEEGKGFAYLMQELPRERLGVGAQAIGASEGAQKGVSGRASAQAGRRARCLKRARGASAWRT